MPFKEDINFLDYPTWVVSQRTTQNHLTIIKKHGMYQLKCIEGLPVRFDKLVLYYLLDLFFKTESGPCNRIELTRYGIAKNTGYTDFMGKTIYARIMLALRRWKSIFIKFEGVFCEEDRHTIRYFSVIDSVILEKSTGKLSIDFNAQYISQLKSSSSFSLINFEEYKLLERPISSRLYEILLFNFTLNSLWAIHIIELAEKITIEKRSYPSQVLAAIIPAIEEITKKTMLQFSYTYNKKDSYCIFRVKEEND